MIKGKFYTGLPSEMMARTRTVNRQQTHFFWPDETDSESVSSRTKRTVNKPAQITTNNNNAATTQSDFTTKDLVRKQLSSGIEFYDNVNAKTPEARRRRFKKIDNINVNNNNDADFQPERKKLETFSSKIEFYDFEHEKKNVNNERPLKMANLDKNPIKPANLMDVHGDEIKTKSDSTDVTRKRISFITEEKPVEKTKSILKSKNSEEKSHIEKVLVKPLPKRGLLPKNLSKSVENISKMAKNFDDAEPNDKPEKLSTIIKEVKSLNLSQERKFNDYDRNDRDSYNRRSDQTVTRKDRDYERRYPDRYDDRGYDEDEHRYRRNRYDDYDDKRYERSDRFDRNEKINRDDGQRYRNETTHRMPHLQARDNCEYQQRSHHFDASPIRDRRSPNHERYDYEREYNREPKHSTIIESKPIPRTTIRHEEEEYSSAISRKPKHIPQHLRTNILFNGRVMSQPQRPISVRNSAVTRVGVGLPDYE